METTKKHCATDIFNRVITLTVLQCLGVDVKHHKKEDREIILGGDQGWRSLKKLRDYAQAETDPSKENYCIQEIKDVKVIKRKCKISMIEIYNLCKEKGEIENV